MPERKLRTLVLELLERVAEPADFLRALQAEPAIRDCDVCHAAATRVAEALADEKREASSAAFSESTPARICRRIAESRPLAWPPAPRWPELEAVVDSRRAGFKTRFMEIVRNLELLEGGRRKERGRWLRATAFLRRYLLTQATPAELALAAMITGDEQLEARAYRDQSLLEAAPPRGRDRWEQAAERLAPSGVFRSAPALRALRPSRARISPRRAIAFASVIDKAVAQLEQLEEVAAGLCVDATARGYAFSVVNLINVEEGIVEAIAGTGESARWVGRVRHPIHPHLEWQEQDIQCEVLLSSTAELVMPDDPRLDEFVKTHFQHTSPRFFIPLILVHDANGRVVNSACYWELLPGGLHPSLKLVTPRGCIPRAFGTLEVGIENLEHAKSDFLELAALALRRAPELYRCTLPHVLDTIVTVVRRLTHARSTTLHLGHKTGQGNLRWHADYCFRSDAEKAVSWLTPSECMDGNIGGTPRPDGLGAAALRAKTWRTRRGEDLLRQNPKIAQQGYYSMTAFPMLAGPGVGLIYVHQGEGEEPEAEEMPWVGFVVERAARCIRVATAYAAERDRRCQILGQLKTANALSDAVSRPVVERETLATGSLLGLTAADLSLLFKVYDTGCAEDVTACGISFGTHPDRRLLFSLVEAVARLGQKRFVSYEELESALEEEPTFKQADPHASAPLLADLARARAFIEHERIRYLAVLPLRPSRGVTLVVVLVYRRELELEPAEQEHLALVASTVVSALDMSGARERGLAALRAIAGGRSAGSAREFAHGEVSTAWSQKWAVGDE
ncbi:MAG: hypothetical protein EOO73_11810 [Myxococcales bacterium]|nr:MAG: hypothetical protein EOO73_11810 [Myxococcales bacterium]